MGQRKRLALWITTLGFFFGATALYLPVLPCPPEALDCCGPKWVTPKEWIQLKIEMASR